MIPYSFTLGVIVAIFLGFKHPIHTSVTHITYEQESATLQFTHNVFIDDLDKALEKEFGKKCYLDSPKEYAKADSLAFLYVSKYCQVWHEEKEIKTHFIGWERKGENIWLYRESEPLSSPQKLRIKNSIFTEFLSNQLNMTHIDYLGKKQVFKLTRLKSTIDCLL